MNTIKEWTRNDLVVGQDLEIDDDGPNRIIAYIEIWFDVDEKFGTDTAGDDSKWVNLYAKYDVLSKNLIMEYIVSSDTEEVSYEYIPTPSENRLIAILLSETCQRVYHCSLEEFVNESREESFPGTALGEGL